MTQSTSSAPTTQAKLGQLIAAVTAYRSSHAIAAAVELSLPEAMGDETQDLTTLAEATHTRPELLARLVTHLVAMGLVDQRQDNRVQATDIMRMLRADHPQSLRDWLRFEMSAPVVHSWTRLAAQIRTGVPGFEQANGMPLFEFMAGDDNLQHRFDAAMGHSARLMTAAAAAGISLPPGQMLVDIGGGDGTVLATVLDRNPDTSGTLYELPRPERRLAECLSRLIAAGRATILHGSFLQSVPAGGDAYLLSRVLHDFDDTVAAELLLRLRGAARPHTRLFMIEMLIDRSVPIPQASSQDLMMMTLLGGQERSGDELNDLARRAGWRLDKIIPTRTPLSLICFVTAD